MTLYPPHLRHVATLPWETKTSNFLQILKKKQIAFLIASTFVIHPHILIFSVFKIANLSPYWLQIKFFHVSVLLLIYFGDQYVTSEIRHRMQMSLQCLSTVNMILSDKDKILLKSLYLKRYTAKRLTDDFLRKARQSMVLTSCSKSCRT